MILSISKVDLSQNELVLAGWINISNLKYFEVLQYLNTYLPIGLLIDKHDIEKNSSFQIPNCALQSYDGRLNSAVIHHSSNRSNRPNVRKESEQHLMAACNKSCTILIAPYSLIQTTSSYLKLPLTQDSWVLVWEK